MAGVRRLVGVPSQQVDAVDPQREQRGPVEVHGGGGAGQSQAPGGSGLGRLEPAAGARAAWRPGGTRSERDGGGMTSGLSTGQG